MRSRNYLKIAFLTLALFMPNLVSAQIAAFIDLKNPTGKVKSYTEQVFETASGQPTLIEKTQYDYDEAGKLIQKIVYHTIDSTAIDHRVDYVYEDNLLSEEVSIGKFKITYLYDEQGNRIARKYKSEEEQNLERYMYGEKNKLLAIHKYDEEGTQKSTEEYTYDIKSRLIGRKYYHVDSASKNTSASYSLDEGGSIVQERVYASNGHILFSRAYEYDSNKNKTEESRFSPNGNFQNRGQYKYQYDQHGNWTSLKYTSKSGSYLIMRSIIY